MYYLITGDMSTYYGYGDREEIIIYKHQGTYTYNDLDDARLEGQRMVRDGEIEAWVLLGPQTNGSTWRGLVYNDSGETLTTPHGTLPHREGYDPLDGSNILWTTEE